MIFDAGASPGARASVAARCMAWSAGLWLLWLPSGCGRVHDLSIASEPLLTVHGHVDLSTLTRTNADVALLGALIWAAVPTVNPVCLPLPSADAIGADCPDPYGVVSGEVSSGATIDASGDFDVTLLELPKLALSVGDQSTRIAYGSLVVVEDIDGDGQPSIALFDATDARDAATVDRIVASSFYSLRAPQQRLAFREGGFVIPSSFYPACLWSPAQPQLVPPPGFSFLEVPTYADPLPPADACQVVATAARVTIPPIPPAEGLGLLCRPTQEAHFNVNQPRNDPEPAGDSICLGPQLLVKTFPGKPCGWLRSYALKGCRQDAGCASPEWDITASPPPWWPCH